MLTSAENEWQLRYNFLIFWKKYSITFKRVVMDSGTINGSIDAGETIVAQSAKISIIKSNPENFWPNFNHMSDLIYKVAK